ncbi:MAG: MBL fold metallo-hydrolase [Dehalococcoidia bacterium]
MIIRPLVVGPLAENTYIVGSEATGQGIVIDPGAEAQRILDEVRRLGLTIIRILNTHGHSDHIGAVAALKEATGAPYGVHAGDLFLIRDTTRPSVRDLILQFRDPPEPDGELQDGEAVQVGELQFQVLETPGHTPGSVCYYGQGVVFTGDTLFQGSIGRFDTAGGDGRQLMDSIVSKLLTLPDETRVLPGHGPESTIGQERQYNPFLRPEGRCLLGL